MTIELITALGAFLAGVGGIVSSVLLHRKTMVLLEYRMNQVEKKLDAHNGYAKMFAENSANLAKIETDIAVIKTSIKYLEREIEE